MESLYDYKITADGFDLQLSNTVTFAEREIHSYHEILYCPEGQALLRTENRQLKLREKNLLIIPKGRYHFFDLSGAERFPRLKIAVPDEIVSQLPESSLFSEIQGYSVINLHLEFLIRQISGILSKPQGEKRVFYLASAVRMLIAELDGMPPERTEYCRENSEMLVKLTEHIARNLAGDLRIRTLADAFSVSPSFLTHRFQKEVGISLHRYITQKRMVYAQGQIDSGSKPTQIYTDCGYSDYSSFYKAYCEFYHVPPSGRAEK